MCSCGSVVVVVIKCIDDIDKTTGKKNCLFDHIYWLEAEETM